MGRAPCCDKANVKRGPWSPEEDAKLKNYIQDHGTGGNWIALPLKIGLKRCGKSCRLRWLNYLRPNIKHGGFSDEEDNIICTLYMSIGSRWSIIAAQLPGRTDNDIKNYWNTKLKKKLLGKHRKELQRRRSSSTSTSSSSNNKSFVVMKQEMNMMMMKTDDHHHHPFIIGQQATTTTTNSPSPIYCFPHNHHHSAVNPYPLSPYPTTQLHPPRDLNNNTISNFHCDGDDQLFNSLNYSTNNIVSPFMNNTTTTTSSGGGGTCCEMPNTNWINDFEPYLNNFPIETIIDQTIYEMDQHLLCGVANGSSTGTGTTSSNSNSNNNNNNSSAASISAESIPRNWNGDILSSLISSPLVSDFYQPRQQGVISSFEDQPAYLGIQ